MLCIYMIFPYTCMLMYILNLVAKLDLLQYLASDPYNIAYIINHKMIVLY